MTEGNGDVGELPKGWCFTTAIEACIQVIDCHNKTAPYIDAGIKLVRTTNIRNGSIDLTNTKFVDQPTYEFWSRRCPPEPGDILFTREAPMAEVGMIPAAAKLCMGQRMMLLRADNKNLLGKYLLYALQSPYIHRYAEKVAVGTGVKHMRVRDVELLPILVAPLNEQYRIIEKIEELFSDLDQGIESLKAAQKQLKVYRQAVLKWAFEGKLTEAWRKQHAPSTLKTGAALLAQIKAERENRDRQQLAEWEEKVREWEAIGKAGKKPTKPQKPKELKPLTEVELAELPELPSKWCWEKFSNVVSDICLGKMLDKEKNKGILMPYLRNINVRWGDFDLDALVEMRFEDHEEERYGIKYGDLIICEGGEPGRAAIWKEQIPNMKIQKALHRARFFKDLTLNKFVMYFLFFSASTGYMSRFFTGTTIKHLTGQGLSDLTIPILSFEEQEQIIQEIESRLSICDQLEATIIENLQKAEALRQSILKQAFEGKLVPQDPNDEPAEKLLERIKAERQEKRSPQTSKQLKIKGI